MRNLTLAFLSLIGLVLLNSCNNSNKHIGEWIIEDRGTKGYLILDANKNVTFSVDNYIVGGDNFEIDGNKTSIKYEIDYSKNPIWIDFIFYVTKNGTSETKNLSWKGIMRFISDDKMEIRMDRKGNSERFTGFNPEDQQNTMVFIKK